VGSWRIISPFNGCHSNFGDWQLPTVITLYQTLFEIATDISELISLRAGKNPLITIDFFKGANTFTTSSSALLTLTLDKGL
jgi:hypothetical protein